MEIKQEKFKSKFFKRRPKQKGVALLVAVSALTIILYLATEVMYDSTVEYTVHSQGLNRLRAYYAARAGLEIGLLRIKIFQSAQNRFGAQLKGTGIDLDMIWKFPFVWPIPDLPDISGIDKDAIKKFTQESLMQGSYSLQIQEEGSKLDLADLISPVKASQESARKRILQFFESKVDGDEEFKKKYQTFRFEDLVNAITDWISPNQASVGGGDKRQGYEELNKNQEYYPPNRMFRTMGEMKLVRGMNDEIFELLKTFVTIHGQRGVNPNLAEPAVLKSLDPGITDEIAKAITKRRADTNEGGPFKDDADFWGFVQQKGAQLKNDPKLTKLYFKAPITFTVKSTGESGGALREISVIVVDLDSTAGIVSDIITAAKQPPAGQPPATPPNPNDPTKAPQTPATTPAQLPKGPPRIVYWSER